MEREQKTVITIPYCPHEKQIPFHESKAKFKAMICGVGAGKSAAGVNEMIKEIITHPGSINLIFAPTVPMLKNTTMQEFWKFCPREIILEHNRTEHLVTFINGAKLLYLSGDNERNIDRLRGLNLGAAYGDELAISPEYIWKIIIARLRNSKGSLRAWITTTPKGFGWLYDWFIRKKSIKNREIIQWFGGTTDDNPYVPQEYKDTLKASYSGSFLKQEFYGEFVGFEGCVYQEFSRNVHIGKYKNKDFAEYVVGLDWGWTNPNAFVLVGKDGDGRFYVISEIYEKRLYVENFAALVKEKIRGLDIVSYADPSEPQFIDKFNDLDIYCTAANNELLPGINKIGGLLKIQEDGKPRLFVDESCVNTIMEFENYRYPDVPDEKPSLDKPIKLFDHLMDALRYAVMGGKEFYVGELEV